MTQKEIRINGYSLPGPLLVEDPQARRVLKSIAGQRRHVRSYTQPGRLRRYLQQHPEGLIIAGCGLLMFVEPVPVTAAGISYDENGSADIQIRENAKEVELQIKAAETAREMAETMFWTPPKKAQQPRRSGQGNS